MPLIRMLAALILLMLAASASFAAEKDLGNGESDSTSFKSMTETKPWPDEIGPFAVYSTDKQHSLRLGLAVQLLFQVDSKDMGSNTERDNIIFFEARRVRPSLKASLMDGLFEFYLHLSTAPNSLEFMDGYINYKAHAYAQIRVGQWKIPFTRYRIQSFKNLTFADWAIVSKYFGAERQMGLAIHSGLESAKEFDYALGVFTGQNARASHSVALPKLYGEFPENPSDLARPGSKMEFHPELVGRFGYNYGGIDVKTDTDWNGGPFRFSIGASSAWDINPRHPYDLSLRLAPEFLMKVHGFSFSTIAYLAWVDLDDGNDIPGFGMWGGLVQASYLIVKRVEISIRYSVVDIQNNVTDDARSRANVLIAKETDPDTKDVLIDQYGKVGRDDVEHEATFGINVYIIGKSLKWQNDISWLCHEYTTDDTRDDVRFRSQLQLAF